MHLCSVNETTEPLSLPGELKSGKLREPSSHFSPFLKLLDEEAGQERDLSLSLKVLASGFVLSWV